MHIHIRILDGADRFYVIQPKAFRNLTKIRRRHGIQKPRHHLLDASRLLLRQFVNHGRLRDALNVNVLTGLPRAIVRRIRVIWRLVRREVRVADARESSRRRSSGQFSGGGAAAGTKEGRAKNHRIDADG